MIAHHVDRPVGQTSVDQEIKSLLARRTSIDVVAQEDLDYLRSWAAGYILINEPEGLAKQIGTTVNIAKGIDPDPLWKTGPSVED